MSRINLKLLARKYPWLLPVLCEIASSGITESVFGRSMVASRLNISSKLAHTIFYMLTKLGLLEKVSEGLFKLTDMGRNICRSLYRLMREGCYHKFRGVYYVLELDDSFIYSHVKSSRITGRYIPKQTVNMVLNLLKDSRNRVWSVQELSRILDVNPEIVSNVVFILELKGIVEVVSVKPKRFKIRGA